MDENKNGIVQIKDLEPDVLREMLKFIYTGKTTQLETMADELLSAADKVNMILFTKCFRNISKGLFTQDAS